MQGMKILCYEALAAGDQPGQAIALSQLQVLQAFAHSSSLIRFLHHSRGAKCDTCLVAMGLEDMTWNFQDLKRHSQPNADVYINSGNRLDGAFKKRLQLTQSVMRLHPS